MSPSVPQPPPTPEGPPAPGSPDGEGARAQALAELRAVAPELFLGDRLDPEAVLRWRAAPARFGLHWAGKSEARALARSPTRATLRTVPSASFGSSDTAHVLVEGDNLETLKVLRRSLARSARLVFLDPPYNTGGDFVYPDDFKDGLSAYLARTGQLGDDGQPVGLNPETSGRFHTNWLNMMLPRLVLARELLTDDGALILTIDDHEVHHLRVVLDEVFGGANFVANCVWQKTFAKKNKALVSSSHDHVLIYAKDARRWDRNLLPRTEDQLTAYRNPDDDPRGRWQSVAYSVPSEDGTRRAAYRYPISTPAGGAVLPPPGRHWNGRPERTAELIADGRLWFGPRGDRRPRLKVFLDEVQGGIVPDTWWGHEVAGHNQEAKKELLELFAGAEPFSTPKPTRLLRHILRIATRPHAGDLVVDFFAGSGTTGHAVWLENAEDGGDRRFLLVQLPHPTGLAHAPTIAELTRQRLEAAAARLDPTDGLDRGLRVLRLDTGTLDAHGHCVDEAEASRRSRVDRALELALRLGCPPHVSLEAVQLAGLPWTRVGADVAWVCLAGALSDALCVEISAALLAEWPPDRPGPLPVVVLLEHAFASDAGRLGLVHTLRQAGFPRVWTP